MGKTIAFLAACPGSATIEEQLASFDPGDQVVKAERASFAKLESLLAQNDMALERGDRLKVHSLKCLTVSTSTLIRLMTNWLGAGVALEIVSAGIAIEPVADNKLFHLLEALDGHYRFVHGIKTQQGDCEKRGRKELLEASSLSAVRAMLDAPGATATGVAKELGVARSTLFNFLERYDSQRRSERKKKVVQRDPKQLSDAGHVSQRKAIILPTNDR